MFYDLLSKTNSFYSGGLWDRDLYDQLNDPKITFITPEIKRRLIEEALACMIFTRIKVINKSVISFIKRINEESSKPIQMYFYRGANYMGIYPSPDISQPSIKDYIEYWIKHKREFTFNSSRIIKQSQWIDEAETIRQECHETYMHLNKFNMLMQTLVPNTDLDKQYFRNQIPDSLAYFMHWQTMPDRTNPIEFIDRIHKINYDCYKSEMDYYMGLALVTN